MSEHEIDATAAARERRTTHWVKGERHHRAVLTEADVRTIRDLRTQGMGPLAIGKTIGRSASAVGAVIYGRNWKNVP